MKHIDAHQHAVMLERSLEDCRDFTVGDQLSRGADRLIEASFIANLDSTRKQLASKHADFVPLLHDCLIGSTQLRCEFRLVNLPVKPLDALAACNKLGLADSHNHRSSASCCNSLTMSQNSRMAKTSSVVAACSCQFEHIWKVSNSFSTPCALCRSASCRIA